MIIERGNRATGIVMWLIETVAVINDLIEAIITSRICCYHITEDM